MARSLFTVGYEGRNIDSFITQLKKHSIDCLIDVREIPLSRKKGFSKSALSQRLSRENIHYIHFRDLGSPKPLRENLKLAGDYTTFFDKIDQYLADKKETIEKAYNLVSTNTRCLMCFEKLAATCHRKIVARKIKTRDGNGLKIMNI